MIDYEKLKEIVGQLSLDAVNGKIELSQHSSTRSYLIALIDVVDKCRKLIKLEPKYTVGEIVWFLDYENVIDGSTIMKIEVDSEIRYGLAYDEDVWFQEEDLYPIRIDAIKAQITRWNTLLLEAEK